MAGPGRRVLLSFCLLAAALGLGCGGYVVTTPRQWTSEAPAQLCVVVTDSTSPRSYLKVSVTTRDWKLVQQRQNVTILPETTIRIPAGKSWSCYEVPVPSTDYYSGTLHVSGTVCRARIDRTVTLNLKTKTETTFVQADKYLYRPGQNVKFRILTLTGSDLLVSREEYPEVWVTTPSRTRIAQWKKVDNSAGLVHLDFDLADEPEKGIYRISVKTIYDTFEHRNFKVEDFVLPRFEVTLKPPSYILATDEKFTYTVCANYTFGQPVKGNLSLQVSNSRRQRCKKEITTNVTISGCTDVELTTAEMKVIDCNVYRLSATATVTEGGTGVEMQTSNLISITRTAVTFRTIYADRYVKPNLPFALKMRAELPDGSPAGAVPMEVCAAGRCSNVTTAPDGIFTTILPPYDTNRVFIKPLNCRANMYQSEFSMRLEHYFSPSNSSLLIYAPEGELKCEPGEALKYTLPVFFSATDQTSASITVQVISRGKIQYFSTYKHQLVNGSLLINTEQMVEPLAPLPQNTIRGVVYIHVYLPPTASPSVKLLVWYTRMDGEVVSDTRELKVERCLGSSVNLTWSESRAEPGSQAWLSLRSEPHSLCSLGVVDRSSELLAEDPDPITVHSIFNYVDTFKLYPWLNSQYNTNRYCRDKQIKEEKEAAAQASQDSAISIAPRPPIYPHYYSSYVDALKMFDDSGLYIFTDLTVETRPCVKEETYHLDSVGVGSSGSAGIPLDLEMVRPPPGVPAPQATGEAGVSPDLNDSIKEALDAPRTNFPETWLWDLVLLPPSGVRKQEVTLPDTITQWVGKAVCVHPQKGVGLSQRETITTFTPFFVDLTLPPTVKRGEILPVKMSVFNYLGQDIPVTLMVQESFEFEILEDLPAYGWRGKRISCVPAQDKVVLTVKIRPTVIGDVNITVAAFVDHQYPWTCGPKGGSIEKRDALIKPIKVEAEGFLKEKTWTKYICSKDFETGEDSLEAWRLEIPHKIVETSERGWVTVVGDLLALSLENLGHLIRMPYGCGEQNMINFAPNIFIMQYLKATNQTTPEATEKLLYFMNTGYQRQHLYRRNDGSFSAFGNADGSGSTWLTAFVLKSFAQAQKYISIDKDGLTASSEWLKEQQGSDGCFIPVGKVLHKGLKGGVANSNSSVPLTAYVMISLLESGEDPKGCPFCYAANCLRADQSNDLYTLALKAYAFALARFPEAETVLKRLLYKASLTRNSIHWELPNGPGKSKSIELEIAGYAIMAMMTQNPKKFEPQSRKVVKWITAQRNGQGGFYSTQDTVVALQAMAVYESHLYQGPLNVVATVTASGLTHSFTVTDDNKLLQQLVTLPTIPTTVYINMEGQGCAVLQAVLRYNVHESEESSAFDLNVYTLTVPDEKCLTKRITVCTAYRLPDGESNMAIIQVDLTSGYIPEKEDLRKLLREDVNVKRYDIDDNMVSFYIEELTNVNTCVSFRVIREVEMENVKAGKVLVYDYYQPELVVTKRYTLPPPTLCL